MANSENFTHFNPDKQHKKPIHLNNIQANYVNNRDLEKKHNSEKKDVFIKYEKEKHKVIGETKEHLNKEQLIHKAKTDIYKKMGIDSNINKNSPLENFEKGIIDTLIIGNYDLAIEIYNTNGKVLIDALKQLASWEGLKQIAEALGESITGLFTGNAYEKGKSIAELGLVGTGAFAGLKIAKFGVKKLKNNLKNIPKNEIVKSNDVKNVVGDTKKLVYGILEKKSKENNIKIIDRRNLKEDIPRENVRLREIKEFQELSNEQISKIDNLLQDVIGGVKYNSFEKIDKLLSRYEKEKLINPNITLIDVFQKIDLGILDKLEGSNCVGMSYILKEELKKQGIDSYVVRFDAGGLLNNSYVENGHAALVTPLLKNGKKYFILSDPGLLIPQSVISEYGRTSDTINIGNKNYKIDIESKGDLPYVMDIDSKKKLYFDPYNEWLNPNETINKDIMRAIKDFKIVKQDRIGKVESFYKLDIEKGIITLSMNGTKEDIIFDDFLKIKENKENFEIFSELSSELGQDSVEFYNKNINIITNIDEYRGQIRAPSVRELKFNNK